MDDDTQTGPLRASLLASGLGETLAVKTTIMKRLYVNEPSYDDVGSVLMRLGLTYQPAANLPISEAMDSVYFINCGGPVEQSHAQLKAFIRNGGTIYASDLQAPLIAELYPNLFHVGGPGHAGAVEGTVVDPGLRSVIGPTVPLTFDLGSWKFLKPLPQAKAITFVEWSGQPLVLSSHIEGQGIVFFTAFHNVRQTSLAENELLRFLLFRPLLSQDIQKADTQLRRRDAISVGEYTSGLRENVKERVFEAPPSGNVIARVSWIGQARIEMMLQTHAGVEIAGVVSWSSPLELAGITPSDGGRILVRCVEFVSKEIPFSLGVALSSGERPRDEDASRLRGTLIGRKTTPANVSKRTNPRLAGTLFPGRKDK